MSNENCVVLCAVLLAAATTNPMFGQESLDPSFYDSLEADFSTQASANQLDYASACCEPSCGADSGCDCGDGVSKKKAAPNPCAASHKGLFYANDFSYLKDPSYQGACLGDGLKLMPLAGGDWGTLDIGGQWRLRYHGEVGMGRECAANVPRFRDTNNDYLLSRLRLYANWKLSDMARIYVEGILANATDDGGDYFRRPTDYNRGDFLNLFIDLKLTDSLTARVGRQELLYGAQRLVSPLDWANTRRTFDGARVLYKQGDWAVDVFFTYFVAPIFNELDEADSDQPFYGAWTTYSGFENFTVDAYYLGYDNSNVGASNGTAAFSLHTLGLRLSGGVGNWLWELEGGPQFGRQSGVRGGVDQSAGFATAGVGRKMQKLPGGSTLWFYYDYASGDDGAGNFNAFSQLFPLGHKYFGFIDAVQCSNIEAPNILYTMKPGPKWNFLLWYWHFMSNTDAPVPSIGNTPPQNASKDLGDELDVLLKYTICPRSDVVFGWSHFWQGNKIIGTTDADFLYGQYTINF